jgi:hypothetical protein
MGSTKMCLAISRHILNGQMGQSGKKEAGSTKVLPPMWTLCLFNVFLKVTRSSSPGLFGLFFTLQKPRSHYLFLIPFSALLFLLQSSTTFILPGEGWFLEAFKSLTQQTLWGTTSTSALH